MGTRKTITIATSYRSLQVQAVGGEIEAWNQPNEVAGTNNGQSENQLDFRRKARNDLTLKLRQEK
jgi:hypothetical protein